MSIFAKKTMHEHLTSRHCWWQPRRRPAGARLWK